MPKNIIICSDGTNNTKKNLTNVRQFHDQLRKNPGNKCFYDKGVGTGKLDFLGKAVGTGLNINILQCYDFLVSNYQSGDRVSLFGFSRGAYPVRSLANFISVFGLVKKNKKKIPRKAGKPGAGNPRRPILSVQQSDAKKAYGVYKKNRDSGFEAKKNKQIKKLEMSPCPILCLGVWDTVGALGLPDGWPKVDLDKPAFKTNKHHMVDPNKNVKFIYHALCIDDRRHEFHPVLFKPPYNGNTVEEVWFSGMHSDVGGGYTPDRSENGHAKDLSNISLRWMAGKVPKSLGMSASLFPSAVPKGKMHDSMKDPFHRKKRSLPDGAKLHKSVRTRITGPLSLPNPVLEPSKQYRPAALDKGAYKVDYQNKPGYGLEPKYEIV